MKKLMIPLFVYLFHSIALAINPPGEKFISTEASFSIEFPASYKTETMNVDGSKFTKITAVKDEITYLAGYTIFKENIKDPWLTAMNAASEAGMGCNCDHKDNVDWKVGEKKGRKITLPGKKREDKNTQFNNIVIGNIYYVVTVSSAKKDWDQKSADDFINSFQFTK